MNKGEKLLDRVEFLEKMPASSCYKEGSVLIFDRKLLTISPKLKKWIESFSLRYGVVAGEELKAVENLGSHVQKILKLVKNISIQKIKIISLGGGSLGDFSGFVASVLKRGVRLEHIPSTWLAAMDSSHGGKTALNVAGIKNQIGTFYLAERVVIVKELLQSQPKKLEKEAMGELAKILLITEDLWLETAAMPLSQKETLWYFLDKVIKGKYDVVEQDFKDDLGLRQILNFGHTLGHVFESYYLWSHGKAIGQGLIFAIQWSARRHYLSKKKELEILEILETRFKISNLSPQVCRQTKEISIKNFNKFILSDKKLSSQGKINFIFLEEKKEKRTLNGLIKKIDVKNILKEAAIQGWLRQ